MGCFKGIKEEELKNSIFLLSYQQEKGEGKDAERDFEFFVFVDTEDKKDRPDFLEELHHCLIKWKWKDGQPTEPKNDKQRFAIPEHEHQLREWLKSDGIEDESLITPLNWLKIAIERYPYRLFVVIDTNDNNKKTTWKVNGYSPLNEEFWFNKDKGWIRSPFLYKRICWVGRREFENKINNPDEFKIFIKSEWIKHLEKLKNNPDISVFIDTAGQKIKEHIPKTLPLSLLRKTNPTKPNESEKPENDSQQIEFLQNCFTTELSKAKAIFGHHHDSFKVIKNRAGKCDPQKQVIFYTGMSGVQFQLPIIVAEKLENKVVGIIETCLLNVGLMDERFIQWWDGITEDDKKEIVLFNRLFPVSNGKIESKDGCAFNEEYKIEIKDKFTIFKTFNRNPVSLDFLIIHQTIWESLSEKDSIRNILLLKDYIPFIIITSGRGKPHNLPKGSKFLPFSDVEFFLLKDYPEKFLFLKIIMSIRAEARDE